MHGWLPVSVQILTVVAVVTAIGWRTRRWRMVWVPWSALIGAVLAFAVYCYIRSAGVADAADPAPRTFWMWIALSGFAFGVLVAGWRGTRWWRRGVSALSVPLCVLSTALVLNLWVGYFPNVQTACNQLTAEPLPDQIDQVAVAGMLSRHDVPVKGSVVAVDIPGTASGFKHRQEFVYLPPAWFATDPPPALPAVMMIGGEFNTPADWMRAGGAVKTLDDFAAAHGGYAPVFVFVDPGGTFNNDTECVNGVRGNAADHLVDDVVPYVKARFGVSANWGVVGWSMGGTCAVDLAVMHPDVFGTFVDIAGDAAPNAGTRAETIDRLFAGNTAAYASFDPATVINQHGPYRGEAGWFDVNDAVGVARDLNPNAQAVAAESLCALGRSAGIDCTVVSQPGNHDWPFASTAFKASLPWLAAKIGTPSAPQLGLSGTVRG